MIRTCLFALPLALVATTASAATTVPGTANPLLAGMPDGSTAAGGDTAPAQSPVLVPRGGSTVVAFTFSVTGGVSNDPQPNFFTPDGDASRVFLAGSENGISFIQAPITALMGVFLAAGQPDASPAPPGTNYDSTASRDFNALSPALKQVFFIGDGRNGSGEVQVFNVPVGATRLFLGVSDGSEWRNNSGSWTVDITPILRDPIAVPAPPAAALLGFALLGLAVARRRPG